MTLPTKFSIEHSFSALRGWVSDNGVEILLAGAAGVAVYLVLNLLVQLAARLRDRLGDRLGVAVAVARALSRTTHVFMILASAELVSGYAEPPAAVGRTIGVLFTIVAVIQGALWIREIILGLIEHRTTDDAQGETLANAMGIIRVLVTTALFAIALVVILDNLGVNVTGLVAGLGIGGIAIGLAAQGIFSDLFAALSIIFDKPFRQGEAINYDSTTAVVQRIGLKSTRLRAITGESKVISNANLLQKEITSFQGLDRRRIKFGVGVIYQTDPDMAARIPDILKAVVEANDATFVRSGFTGFGASSLDFEVEFDVFRPSWDDVYAIRHGVGLGILKRFNQEGLEFAYPTQTTFTAAPDGRMIMPYPEVMPVRDTSHDPEAAPQDERAES